MLVELNSSKMTPRIEISIESDLPCELMMEIFRRLDYTSFLQIQCVCRYFYVLRAKLLKTKLSFQELLPYCYPVYLNDRVSYLKNLQQKEWLIWRKGPCRIAGLPAQFLKNATSELEISSLRITQIKVKSYKILREGRKILGAQKREKLRIDYCKLMRNTILLIYLFGLLMLVCYGSLILRSRHPFMYRPSHLIVENVTRTFFSCPTLFSVTL